MEQVKQTATEWLLQQMDLETISKYDKQLVKAKEMEKQQIINTYRDGRSDQQSEKPSKFYNRWAELYYYETYGN
jgi:hypothetical protein